MSLAASANPTTGSVAAGVYTGLLYDLAFMFVLGLGVALWSIVARDRRSITDARAGLRRYLPLVMAMIFFIPALTTAYAAMSSVKPQLMNNLLPVMTAAAVAAIVARVSGHALNHDQPKDRNRELRRDLYTLVVLAVFAVVVPVLADKFAPKLGHGWFEDHRLFVAVILGIVLGGIVILVRAKLDKGRPARVARRQHTSGLGQLSVAEADRSGHVRKLPLPSQDVIDKAKETSDGILDLIERYSGFPEGRKMLFDNGLINSAA